MKKRPTTKRVTKLAEAPSTSKKPRPSRAIPGAKRGQPTAYRPEYCEAIIEHAKKLGGTLQSFAISLEVHSDTLLEWAKVHPEFSVARRRAKEIQEQKMLELGMRGMRGMNGQGSWQAAWVFAMKARFKWREESADEEDESDVEFQFE